MLFGAEDDFTSESTLPPEEIIALKLSAGYSPSCNRARRDKSPAPAATEDHAFDELIFAFAIANNQVGILPWKPNDARHTGKAIKITGSKTSPQWCWWNRAEWSNRLEEERTKNNYKGDNLQPKEHEVIRLAANELIHNTLATKMQCRSRQYVD